MKHIVQFSGGKDSTAMLYKMLLNEMQIDEVVFFDTGWEFDSVYRNIEKTSNLIINMGIKFTVLYPEKSFDYLAFEKTVNKRNGTIGKGYSWCGGVCRWGTTEKLKALEKYCANDIQYVGIAADEKDRLMKGRKGVKKFLLAEWGMTESDALKYSYQNGVVWQEEGVRLYDVLDRGSCFCCGNKNLKELKGMYLTMPEYWDRLKQMQSKTERLYKKVGLQALEKRFEIELTKENAQMQLSMFDSI